MSHCCEWWGEVEGIIEAHSMLKHPFYQAWQMGQLSLEDLRYYAGQYYHHVKHFPRYVSSAHSVCEDLPVRQMLLENLTEEEKGEENHPELWLRFSEGLGLSREGVLGTPAQNETSQCVEAFYSLTRSHPLAALAALYAYESQIPAVSATKMKGLEDFYGIKDDRSRKFFKVHEEADVWHSRVEREAIQKMAHGNPQGRQLVKRSVESACKAVWKLLDGVVEARGICASCAA